MKKIISLMLVIICMMSLMISGCDKQEIEPVTSNEIFDLLKNEGYDNIQHEENSGDYILVDSGDSEDKDKNDIFITLRTDENDEKHIIQDIYLACDFFTEEFEDLSRYILTYITKDDAFVNEIILSSKTEIAPMKEKGKFMFFGLSILSDDDFEEIKTDSPDSRRYRIMLSLCY